MIHAPRRSSGTRSRRTGLTARPAVALLAMLALGSLPACTPPSLLTLRSGLDSLRTVVDTLAVRDSVTYATVLEMRRELAEQRDILLSARATTGSTTQELSEQNQRLQSRIDELMGRFTDLSKRQAVSPPATGPGTPGGPAGPAAPATGPDPNQLYDQAAQDLTQGRYDMALLGFRDFVQRYPTVELADNARYGIGECFFAQAKFDSASQAYAQVEAQNPQGDKVPASLYKLGLCEEKLGHADRAKQRFEDLVKRFPLSGEAQLARERLGDAKKK